MHSIRSFPPTIEIRLACRYATIEGRSPDTWTFSESYRGTMEELNAVLPYLRKGDAGMEFKLVKVTTSIEDIPEVPDLTKAAAGAAAAALGAMGVCGGTSGV